MPRLPPDIAGVAESAKIGELADRDCRVCDGDRPPRLTAWILVAGEIAEIAEIAMVAGQEFPDFRPWQGCQSHRECGLKMLNLSVLRRLTKLKTQIAALATESPRVSPKIAGITKFTEIAGRKWAIAW